LTPNKRQLPADLMHLVPPFFFEAVSRDGWRALVRCFSAAGTAAAVTLRLDIKTGDLAACRASKQAVLEGPIFEFARPRPLRTHVSEIGVLRGGDLLLKSRRGRWWPIVADLEKGEIRLSQAMTTMRHHLQPKRTVPFRRCDGLDRGYTLAVADLPAGGRAWLDSRGLLHLASGDPSLPECSLVLTEGPMAGWLSDGRVFGPSYWLASLQAAPVRDVIRDWFVPFVKRLT
jgi:hypothetical protein